VGDRDGEILGKLHSIEQGMTIDRARAHEDRAEMRELFARLIQSVDGLTAAISRQAAASPGVMPAAAMAFDRRTLGWLALAVLVLSVTLSLGQAGARELLSVVFGVKP